MYLSESYGDKFDANTEFLVDDINAGTLIMDKWDVSYVPTPTVLPTAPRILTQSQIYSINEIIKNNERNINYRASAPTCSDIFAIIPLDKKVFLPEIYMWKIQVHYS